MFRPTITYRSTIIAHSCVEDRNRLNEATTAAAWQKWQAVALRERSAAFVPFQRQAPGIPPTQNVDSAVSPVPTAGQFSGSIAQIANCAVKVNQMNRFESTLK